MEELEIMRKPSRLRRWLIISVGLSVIALVIISIATMDRRTFEALSHLEPFYLLLALGVALTRWGWSALRIRILARPSQKVPPFRNLLKVVYSGYFAGVITPWRSGGVATETYFLYRYGLDPGIAAAIISFGACMSTLLLLLSMPVTVVVSVRDIHLSLTLQGILYLAMLIGLIFLVVVIVFMRSPKERTLATFQRLFPRLIQRERFKKFVTRFSEEAEKFSLFLREIIALGWKTILYAGICSLFFWLSGLLVIPLVLVGMGHPELFLKSMVAQLVVQCLLPFVPLPGGSGVGEVGFFVIYNQFLPPEYNLAGLLTVIWRFFDFYLGILIGGGFFLLVLKDIKEKTAHPSTQPVSKI
jgi:hypothetical protein